MHPEDTMLRMGPTALFSMSVSRLRYPLLLGLCVLGLGLVSHFLHAPHLLAAIVRYGTFFVIVFAVFMALTAVPEYFGLAVRFGPTAFFLRYGLITYRETSISYARMEQVSVLPHPILGVLGLKILVIACRLHGRAGSDIVLPAVDSAIALHIEKQLRERMRS